jgi:hypothetical protein
MNALGWALEEKTTALLLHSTSREMAIHVLSQQGELSGPRKNILTIVFSMTYKWNNMSLRTPVRPVAGSRIALESMGGSLPAGMGREPAKQHR